ncbi:hypothetical protein H4Q26_009097 [Puccinia striiformis f. sp. tritici PST-130]|nr:hypothetical protein H4Q26_009097 [Puccinia striiformis f. sp. tritici PST-130]
MMIGSSLNRATRPGVLQRGSSIQTIQVKRPMINKNRWNSSKIDIKNNIGSRLPKFQRMIKERYPGISAKDIPSLTLSFLFLHELTALLPLLGIFSVVYISGTGEYIVQTINDSIPASPSSSVHGDGDQMDYKSNPVADFVTDSIDQSVIKLTSIARRYGYLDDDNNQEYGRLSIVNNRFFASGIVAYLTVKLLLPVRISLSLYLAPSLSRQFQRFYGFAFRRNHKLPPQ